MNTSPTPARKSPHPALLLAGLFALSLGGCSTHSTMTVGSDSATPTNAMATSASFPHADEQDHIEFFASQLFPEDPALPQRLVGRTRKTRDTNLSLDALETIILKPENGLTEPLSASARIFGFQGKFSPCETPNGDPPISHYQAIVQSGGPGTNGIGPADERTFEVDLFGTIQSHDNNVTMMSIGSHAHARTKRTANSTTGTITSVWTNSIVPGTTIPDLPAGATDVRIDAAIVIAGFNELNQNHTKTLCVQFINDDGEPMSRTNQILDMPATTRQLTVNSELGYIILVTFTTTEGPRYLEWYGNIALNNLGQPTAGAISNFSSTNPLRDNGRELAYDMQRRASMMIIRYADKMDND